MGDRLRQVHFLLDSYGTIVGRGHESALQGCGAFAAAWGFYALPEMFGCAVGEGSAPAGNQNHNDCRWQSYHNVLTLPPTSDVGCTQREGGARAANQNPNDCRWQSYHNSRKPSPTDT